MADTDDYSTEPDPYADFNRAIYGTNKPQNDDTIPEPPAADDQIPEGEETQDAYEPEELRFGNELNQLAKSYGFTDEDIDSIESEDELRRAMRILDRQMIASLNQTMPPMEQPQYSQQQPAAGLGPQGTVMPEIPPELALQLDMLDEDDPIRKNMEAIVADRNSIRNELSEIRNLMLSQQEVEQKRFRDDVVSWFDSQMDETDSELYGKGTTVSPVQRKNRSDVLDTLLRLAAPDIARGVRPDWDLFLARSRNGVHGLTGKLPESKKRADLIRERSMRRTSAGRAKGKPRSDHMGTIRNLSDDPDLMDEVNAIANRQYGWSE